MKKRDSGKVDGDADLIEEYIGYFGVNDGYITDEGQDRESDNADLIAEYIAFFSDGDWQCYG